MNRCQIKIRSVRLVERHENVTLTFPKGFHQAEKLDIKEMSAIQGHFNIEN